MLWKLVSSFCRTHGLKTSIALLQELARRDNYAAFLYEAERELLTPENVISIAKTNFSDPNLREHISIFLAGMAVTHEDTSSSVSVIAKEKEKYQSNDIFDEVRRIAVNNNKVPCIVLRYLTYCKK